MTDLLDGRYVVKGELVERSVVAAHDTLLDQPVDIILLPAVSEPVERSSALRRFRRELRNGHRALATIEDTGVWADHPFLVLAADSRFDSGGATWPAPKIAAAVLEALEGVSAVRRTGLGLLSLEIDRLRRDDDTTQVVSSPLPILPVDESSTLPAAQRLLTELLDRHGCDDTTLRELSAESFAAISVAEREKAFASRLREKAGSAESKTEGRLQSRRPEALVAKPAALERGPVEDRTRGQELPVAPEPASEPGPGTIEQAAPDQARQEEIPEHGEGARIIALPVRDTRATDTTVEIALPESGTPQHHTTQGAAPESVATQDGDTSDSDTSDSPAPPPSGPLTSDVVADGASTDSPKYVSLTELAAAEPEYVSFGELLDDAPDPDEEVVNATQRPSQPAKKGLLARLGSRDRS